MVIYVFDNVIIIIQKEKFWAVISITHSKLKQGFPCDLVATIMIVLIGSNEKINTQTTLIICP